ncbi:MAG: hypothetical protein MRY32_03395 [Rickettsiales bacterium]|nr:hypothetical protein [Rickettsiales bacterium]
MLKHLLILTCSVLALNAAPAYAEHHEGGMREKIKNMSPEERAAFHKERKEKWEKMSKEEKLQTIEEKRQKRLEKMEERWESMSDDEKIKHVEQKMERRKKFKGHKPPHGGGHHPEPGE